MALIFSTYGEERDPDSNHSIYSASDFVDAVLEATHRIHSAGVPTAVAVRPERFGDEYIVLPLASLTELEEVGWRMCEQFLPE